MTTQVPDVNNAQKQPFDLRAARLLVAPLALAQFIASYAGSNMNVAINDIAKDIGTDVRGVQTAITLFTLVMAALMIPGSKLSDIWGRKRCFRLGLTIYGIGALVAAMAPNRLILTLGYSIGEGVGSALMIPPIYILITVWFSNIQTRARFYGLVSAAAGIGSAAGPLIGGFITSAVSWRASFLLQVAVVAYIVFLSRKIEADKFVGSRPHFDLMGAVLSAAGLVFLVIGVLQSGTYGWGRSREDFTVGGNVLIPEGSISVVWIFFAVGLAILWMFFRHIAACERDGRTPLLASRLFHNRTANLGLVTQNLQWLMLQGGFFVISVYLQTVRDYSAIETGLILSPATIGILFASSFAERMAKRRAQAMLVRSGFLFTLVGMALLLLTADATSSVWTFAPGLFLMGCGIGIMLTASVNVVQSSFPEKDQGEISGLSRSVSNLGSSLGTAIVGSVLVSSLVEGNEHYRLALLTMMAFSFIGFVTAMMLPKKKPTTAKA